MDEKWTKYYTKDQLHTLQRIEIESLKTFISVCKELNLEYVVYGGTLLGVEKYKGMIPWDDDIDVALPRESYERFLKEAPNVLPNEYFIQSPYNCKTTPFAYTKLRRRGTKYIEYEYRNIEMESGIYIDIYPIDKIPDNEKLRKKQFKKVRKWIFIYVCRQAPLYDSKAHNIIGKIKNIGKWVVCHCLKFFPQKYCVTKIDYHMKRYNSSNSKRYAALNSPNYNNIYMKLYPFQKGMFEGIQVFIPGDHRRHLKMRYGDYSKLPPKNKRFGHVPYILDLGE